MFTDIKFSYIDKSCDRYRTCISTVNESDVGPGDITYYEAVLNRIESLVDAGTVILKIEQYK